MSSPSSDFQSSVEEFDKKKESYLKSFQELLSNVPAQPPSSLLTNLSLEDPKPKSGQHIYRDSLGCRIRRHKTEDLHLPAVHENPELIALAQKYKDQFPFLNDYIPAETQPQIVMPANDEDQVTGGMSSFLS